MAILLTTLLFLYIFYVILAWYHLHKFFKYYAKIYEDNCDPLKASLEERPFIREDIRTWSKLELYLGAAFLFPIRIITFILSIVIFTYFIQPLALIGWKENQPFARWRRLLSTIFIKILGFIIILSNGFYWVKVKKVKLKDYLPDYVPPQKIPKGFRAPITICNHQSLMDIFICEYVMASKFNVSFITKKEILQVPLLGKLNVNCQSIFVDRHSRDSKDNTLVQINARCKKIVSNPNDHISGISIFAEGCTSNGRYILSFKKGPFDGHYPINIVGLRYPREDFRLHNDSLCVYSEYFLQFLTMCPFYNSLEAVVFDEPFFPDYLKLDRQNENSWEVYAKEAQKAMANALNLPISQSGYTQMKKYQDYIKGQLFPGKIKKH